MKSPIQNTPVSPSVIAVTQESIIKKPLGQVKKKKKDYTIEHKNEMPRRKSTNISYKRETRALLFPDDSIYLQLEVVICSAYIISVQTFP